MKLSFSEVVGAVRAVQVLGETTGSPSGYSIDSRTIQPGECFVAIQGKNLDGHRFIPQAVEKGASFVIARAGGIGWDSLPIPVILVEETLQSLQWLARFARRKWSGPVVGITGSTGKTTTKEITSFLLSAGFRVYKSLGNFNNDYGLPLSILKLSEWDKVAVLEMGMSSSGEISRLAAIAEPNLGVVTNVKPVHLEFFDSLEGIARAKRELIEALPPDGVAILNNDDTRVRKFSRHFNGKVLTYGIRNAAAYRASRLVFQGLSGTQFQLEHKGASFSFQCPLIGEHNVANCLAALVVSHHFGLSFSVLERRLKELKAHPGRGEVVKFRRGFTVVNDTYNSNPAALEIMVRFLKKVQGAKRRILVAGEMLELGSQSPEFHHNCGKTAAQAGLDFIVGVQGQAQHLVNAARLYGYDEEHALFFNEVPEAADWLQKEVREGDLVVVKGSRGVRTERVLEVLKWRED